MVYPGCTYFNDKIDIQIRWKFSQHRTFILIEYLDNFVQNSRIQISVDQIHDFRSDSWEKWSISYQYRVDFFKKCRYNDIQNAREIEKYSKYCTTNEIHWHACVAMDLAPKHGFWTVWKTGFSNLVLQFSHYFGCIYHVTHWLILQIGVRYQHTML